MSGGKNQKRCSNIEEGEEEKHIVQENSISTKKRKQGIRTCSNNERRRGTSSIDAEEMFCLLRHFFCLLFRFEQNLGANDDDDERISKGEFRPFIARVVLAASSWFEEFPSLLSLRKSWQTSEQKKRIGGIFRRDWKTNYRSSTIDRERRKYVNIPIILFFHRLSFRAERLNDAFSTLLLIN